MKNSPTNVAGKTSSTKLNEHIVVMRKINNKLLKKPSHGFIMNRKNPRRKHIPRRIIKMKEEADLLMDQGHYQASILYYALYSEHLLLAAYLYIKRDEDINEAIREREKILSNKEKGSYSLGKVIKELVPIIESYLSHTSSYFLEDAETNISKLIVNIKDIRNLISAHPHFTLMLDPTNAMKKVMYDANYYRKILRRIRRFIQNEIGIPYPNELDQLISVGNPISLASYLDDSFIAVENILNRLFASYCKISSEKIRERLRSVLP